MTSLGAGFVHGGESNCRGTLRFFETGASLQTENLWVKCDGPDCEASRSLVHAFGKEAQENLPACRGRHPILIPMTDHVMQNLEPFCWVLPIVGFQIHCLY